MNYMQQRYYDPDIGRFLSVDPVSADTTTGWNFNRYNYAANNPYKFTDPDGRTITCDGQYCQIRCSGAACLGDMATYGAVRLLSDARDMAGILFPITQQSQEPTPEEAVKDTIDGIREGKEPVSGTAASVASCKVNLVAAMPIGRKSRTLPALK